jgi:hypothetical protein
MLQGHPFRRHVAVKAESDVCEYLAHDSPLTTLDVSLTREGIRVSLQTSHTFIHAQGPGNRIVCEAHTSPGKVNENLAGQIRINLPQVLTGDPGSPEGHSKIRKCTSCLALS